MNRVLLSAKPSDFIEASTINSLLRKIRFRSEEIRAIRSRCPKPPDFKEESIKEHGPAWVQDTRQAYDQEMEDYGEWIEKTYARKVCLEDADVEWLFQQIQLHMDENKAGKPPGWPSSLDCIKTACLILAVRSGTYRPGNDDETYLLPVETP